jgi:hypothetical protein
MSEFRTFENVWKVVAEGAILWEAKSRVLWDQLRLTAGVPGDMAEIGVYKGHTAKLMRLSMPTKRLHLYDTFKGMVGADPKVGDQYLDGCFADTELERVRKFVGTSGVQYHVGMFPDTFAQGQRQFSFIHSDTDTYFGTKETLRVMMPFVSVGGRVVFDDYEWRKCPGVKKAIMEWLAADMMETRTAIFPNQFVITRVA